MKYNCQDEPNNPRKEFKQRSENRKNMDRFLNITKRMKISIVVLALGFGSQTFAQESPKSILEFTQLNAESEITIPIPKDTLVYVFAPVSILNLDIEAHRVDNDPDGVFSFYKVGAFSVMESKRNDGRVRFSVIRK
mgnify:FL=1